ncbi:alpha/beta fold hydrolase [Microbacterium sp. 1.5R]|uniref:alpha/beta fold hydrolase n=1 Tax=Microbacterium sp. 1.5R TaxID=1916917 RepID=UPI00119FAE76|nr:alpha/beta fold hydrolase [Microbacterium sp. 1.5R]
MSTARQRIVIAGHALRVEGRGPVGSERTFVLVHGIGMSHRYLAPLRDGLAHGARVITVDLPGFGGLPSPREDLDVPAMGALVADVLHTLALERVVLVGHSMGVQWVLEAARNAAPRVAGVVLIGPVVDAAHRSLPSQAVALAVDTLREKPAVNALVFSDYLRCGPRWYLTQARHMTSYATETSVARTLQPMLLIRGARDSVAGAEWLRRLHEAGRDATLVEVPGQPHNVQYTAASRVAEAILGFETRLAVPETSLSGHRGGPTSTR